MIYGSVSLAGMAFSYVERGSGEPILFVHGSLGSYRDFRDQLRHFSSSRRAIAYSRRFHPPNRCDDPDAAYTISGHADDLAEFAAALGLRSPSVVASSWGAYVALDCAVRHPEVMSRLVVGEPPMLYLLRRSERGRTLFNGFIDEALAPAREAFRRGDVSGGVARFYDGVAGKTGSFDALPAPARARLLECGGELRLEFLTPEERYMPEIPDAGLRALTIPILLLSGECSPLMFSVITDELERLLPRAARAMIPSATHAMQVSNAPVYNRTVDRFLSGN